MFDFDEIRPYNDAEAKEAYYRLTEDPRFQNAIAKFLPNYSAEELRRDLQNFNTVDEIQASFIRRWIELFVRQFTSGCTMSGMENIDPDKAYLYISNHRDISFDPAMLQYYFFLEHRRTSKIATGDNLTKTPLMGEIGKVNKMILVLRSGSLREKLFNFQRLSAYIQYSLDRKSVV